MVPLEAVLYYSWFIFPLPPLKGSKGGSFCAALAPYNFILVNDLNSD